MIFSGTVTENLPSSENRFRVTEAFKGGRRPYTDIFDPLRDQIHFKVGEQYIVFAVTFPWESAAKGCLTSWFCSETMEVRYAAALVEQLRAEKGGKPVASVYGMLWRNEVETSLEPMPNVVVRLKSGTKPYETRTDRYGAYAFGQLPKGTYEVSADLPPGLEAGQEILDGPHRHSICQRVPAMQTILSPCLLGGSGEGL